METSPVPPVKERGTWSYPEITLHETPLSLLDELVPYRVVNPASYTDAPSIGAGALLAGSAESHLALATLSKAIRVDLTNPDWRYALVKLTRKDGSSTHASAAHGILMHVRPRSPDADYRLHPELSCATIRVPHAGHAVQQDYGDVFNKENVGKILGSFAEYGTHYVSAIELGDTIVQVFAYPSKQFAYVKQAYADKSNVLSGPEAQLFAQFTTGLERGPYGFVKEYGRILSASNSASFTTDLQQGKWEDTLWSHKDSVFSLFNSKAACSRGTICRAN